MGWYKGMKVLWIVNVVPSELALSMNIHPEVLGGWVEAMAKVLRKKDNIQLGIACKCNEPLSFEKFIKGVHYYSVTYGKHTGLASLKKRCKEIVCSFKPDLIHVEGTEFLHAKAMIEVGKETGIPTILSMQGILNGYYDYQCGHLQMDDLMLRDSLASMLSAWTLHLRKTKWFAPRMIPEREVIENATYILGRTTWDRAQTYAINPRAEYFSCNRNLRQPFYEKNWELSSIERHSIYVGNGYYALKGVHFVIKAVAQLKKEYPDIKVYVAGHKPFAQKDKRPFYKKGYGDYLKRLICDCHVEDRIIFTGPLTAEQVAEKLASVHAYVLCSVVENSPNTLGEAMIIGTPCIASYVGGVPDMATDGEEALIYRDDDPVMLAWKIKELFENDQLAVSLSEKAKKRARLTHDRERNAAQLVRIYHSILECERKP